MKLIPEVKEYVEFHIQQTDRQLKENILEKFGLTVSHVAIGNYKRNIRSEEYISLKVQRILDEGSHMKEAEIELLKSLTQLIAIRQKALPEDLSLTEERKIINNFWAEVRTQQQDMAELIVQGRQQYLNNLNVAVELRLEGAKKDTRYKIKYATQLQERFDGAMIDLSEYLSKTQESNSFPLKFDFDKSTLREDVKNLMDRCLEEIMDISDSEKITDKKRELEYEIFRTHTPNERIRDYRNEIEELNKQESVIGTNTKQLTNTRNKLESLLGEYDHRLQMLESGRREFIGRFSQQT